MFAAALKWNPHQAREPKGSSTGGRFAATTVGAAVDLFKATYPEAAKHYPRSTHTEMGSIEAHTKDVGHEWALQLSQEQLHGISERFGSDVGRLMTAAIALHDIGKAEAIEEGEGKSAQHAHTIPILQKVLRQEGFSEKDVTLATELLNHDLIGPLFRGRGSDVTVAKALTEKAQRVGMTVADFVTLQLAFYQADASAYPYVTSYMQQEPSGKWTFAGNPQIAAIEALIPRARKREYVREPAGSSEGGQFATVASNAPTKEAFLQEFNPKQKGTWYRKSGGWNRDPEGERPFGWTRPDEASYVPPTVTHKLLRGPNAGLWGSSHFGSTVITGEAAHQMGIEGWSRHSATVESSELATRMLQAIADDATGSEEVLYHAFENTRGTVFASGDTMSLPLMAAAGQPETGYATRAEWENQRGAPTVFVFPKGTKMAGYSKPSLATAKDLGHETVEEYYKERGSIWEEAIVAGRFRVVRTETHYMGSQHSNKPVQEGETPHLYGQVVYLEPIGVFNPRTGKWDDHG